MSTTNEKLTEKSVTKPLPKGVDDRITFDTAIAGFGLRTRAAGTRTWIFQYKFVGRTYRMKIGRAPAMKAEDARKLALKYHNSVQQGGNPAVEKEAAKLQAAKSFGDLTQRYLEFKKTGKKPLRARSLVEVERHLKVYAAPLLKLPVASIDRHMIEDVLNKVTKTSTKGSGAVTANRLHASLSAAFAWGMKRELATRNPVIGVDKHEERSRDRVLSDVELKCVWEALEPDNYGSVVKLLVLTGARLNEIGRLRWSEVDLGRQSIQLAPERTKNARSHEIPLTSMALEILEAQPRIEGCEFVFSAGNGSPFSTWSHAKRALDERLLGKVTAPWTTHDLRRTTATGLQRLGVRLEVTEAILGHVGASRGGIVGIYQRHDWAAEKRDALARWNDHVAAVLAGGKSTVTPMKRA